LFLISLVDNLPVAIAYRAEAAAAAERKEREIPPNPMMKMRKIYGRSPVKQKSYDTENEIITASPASAL
jgi:hypothetical protein